MSNLNLDQQNSKKQEYNNEPVFYCKNCLSLRVKTVIAVADLEYCDECVSTEIEQSNIEDWRKLYKERYGIDYLEK